MKLDLKTQIEIWSKPNSKQKTYVATLSALTAGTFMYTAWQFILPTQLDVPKSSIWIQALLIISGIIITGIGYIIQKDGKK